MVLPKQIKLKKLKDGIWAVFFKAATPLPPHWWLFFWVSLEDHPKQATQVQTLAWPSDRGIVVWFSESPQVSADGVPGTEVRSKLHVYGSPSDLGVQNTFPDKRLQPIRALGGTFVILAALRTSADHSAVIGL